MTEDRERRLQETRDAILAIYGEANPSKRPNPDRVGSWAFLAGFFAFLGAATAAAALLPLLPYLSAFLTLVGLR